MRKHINGAWETYFKVMVQDLKVPSPSLEKELTHLGSMWDHALLEITL
jgi:hypothetical protein